MEAMLVVSEVRFSGNVDPSDGNVWLDERITLTRPQKR